MGFAESVVRNLVRIVDFAPGMYGIGLVAMMIGKRTQRLGDLAAGTVVVKERVGHERGKIPEIPGPTAVVPLPVTRVTSALSPGERDLLASFRARAPTLAPVVRARLAAQIAPILRARLSDASSIDDESWLWALAHEAEGGPPA
jgi:hypothetical protein